MRNEPMSLNEALADYYRVRRGRFAASTWRAHEGQLERWRTWITRETQPNVGLDVIADPDSRYMERYFNRLRPPQYSPRSFNNYRQYLVSFWSYCAGEGWVRTNPMRHVDPMRPKKVQRLHLSAHEMVRMLEDATPRDRIALAVGMNVALRASDAAELTVGSVNLSNDTLTAWIEKTDEERDYALTADLRREVLRWFEHYAAAMGLESWRDLPNEWLLIPAGHFQAHNVWEPAAGGKVVYKVNGRPAGRDGRRGIRHPEQIVHRALAKLGHVESKGEGFHTLRRSAARMFHDQAVADGNADAIRLAMSLLGHKSQQTTEIYLGISHEKQRLDAMMRGRSVLHDSVLREAAVSAEADARDDVEVRRAGSG